MTLALPLWFEVVSLVTLTLILAADLLLVVVRPRVPTLRESSVWVAVYVGLALLFAVTLLLVGGQETAGQFLAGWVTEYSLSVDNLFVFVIIIARFAVPALLQQRVLLVGILIALVFRGVFILVGSALIESFSWIFYLFGAFLVYTAADQAFGLRPEGGGDNRLVAFLKRRLRVGDEYDGGRLRTTTAHGVTVFTPLVVVFISIGSTDVLFALDSIPAIFGITQSPFIVFTANLFALMGLRQLYFLLGGLLERLEYLHYGIAFILAFIGVKLVLHALHVNELPFINGGAPVEWAPEIGTGVSLVVIVGAIVVTVVVSLVTMRRSRS